MNIQINRPPNHPHLTSDPAAFYSFVRFTFRRRLLFFSLSLVSFISTSPRLENLQLKKILDIFSRKSVRPRFPVRTSVHVIKFRLDAGSRCKVCPPPYHVPSSDWVRVQPIHVAPFRTDNGKLNKII